MTVAEMTPFQLYALILLTFVMFWLIRLMWNHRHEIAVDLPSKCIFWLGFGSLTILPAYVALGSIFPWLPVP